jgi:hypothetical protein
VGVTPPRLAKTDWKIIRALSEVCKYRGSFSGLNLFLFVVNDPLYLHTSDEALIIFRFVLACPGGVKLQPLLFVVNDPLYLHTSDKALMIFQSVLARPGGVTLQPLLFVVNDPLYLHTSDKALMIFQSV